MAENNQKAPAPSESYETPQGVFRGKPDVAYNNLQAFKPTTAVPVGGEILADSPVEYNKNRKTVKLVVRNTGDRPIQVGSHFHFFEVNRYLLFDRDQAFGCHLNIPSTTAIRFEPGDQKEVELVTYSGKRRVVGFNGLVNGYAGGEDSPTYFPVRIKALAKMRKLGFGLIDEADAEKNYKPTDNANKPKNRS